MNKRQPNENTKLMLSALYAALTECGYNSTVAKKHILPEEANLTQSTLTILKNQSASIDLCTIERICQITGKKPSELFESCSDAFTLDAKLQYADNKIS